MKQCFSDIGPSTVETLDETTNIETLSFLCFGDTTNIIGIANHTFDETIPVLSTILNCQSSKFCFGRHEHDGYQTIVSQHVNLQELEKLIMLLWDQKEIPYVPLISTMIPLFKYFCVPHEKIKDYIEAFGFPYTDVYQLIDYVLACDIMGIPINTHAAPIYSSIFCTSAVNDVKLGTFLQRLNIIERLYPEDHILISTCGNFETLDHLSGGFLGIHGLPADCIVAGGSLVLANCPTSKQYPSMDVDIFVYGENAVINKNSIVKQLCNDGFYIGILSSSVVIAIKDGHMIQIIYSPCESAQQVIYNFDLWYVEAFWNPTSHFMASPAAIREWNNMTITGGRYTDQEPVPPKRLMKAHLKGFDISTFQIPDNDIVQLVLPQCFCKICNVKLEMFLGTCLTTLSDLQQYNEIKWGTILDTSSPNTFYIELLMKKLLGCKRVTENEMTEMKFEPMINNQYGRMKINLTEVSVIPYLGYLKYLERAELQTIKIRYINMPFKIWTPYVKVFSINQAEYPRYNCKLQICSNSEYDLTPKMRHFHNQIQLIMKHMSAVCRSKKPFVDIHVKMGNDTIWTDADGNKIKPREIPRYAEVKCLIQLSHSWYKEHSTETQLKWKVWKIILRKH
jgi:hypothetical protein